MKCGLTLIDKINSPPHKMYLEYNLANLNEIIMPNKKISKIKIILNIYRYLFNKQALYCSF